MEHVFPTVIRATMNPMACVKVRIESFFFGEVLITRAYYESTPNDCLACMGGLRLRDGACVSNCDQGYYESNGMCKGKDRVYSLEKF